MYLPTGQIVLKDSEKDAVISRMFEETKGEGARKLGPNLKAIYAGAGVKTIQRSLNKIKESENLRPLFQNCALLRPIRAKKPQEQNQIDLVNMSNAPVETNGVTYCFILLAYSELRPIESKDSANVARELVNIYNVFGPPAILQSDQGPEFKGTLKLVCAALKVKIIYSSAYSPQPQGKDERSIELGKKNPL